MSKKINKHLNCQVQNVPKSIMLILRMTGKISKTPAATNDNKH